MPAYWNSMPLPPAIGLALDNAERHPARRAGSCRFAAPGIEPDSGALYRSIWASLFSSTYKTDLLNRVESGGNFSYRFDYIRSGPPDSPTASNSLQATAQKFFRGTHLLLRQRVGDSIPSASSIHLKGVM